MYIKANIDDCALLINDFLPKNLFKKISSFNYSVDLDSHNQWEKNLFKDKNNFVTMKNIKQSKILATINKGKIESDIDIFKKFSQTLIDCPFIPYQINSGMHISYYEYDKFAGINWHNDGKYTLNYSFYIHDNWDDNWGGETLINTGRGLPLVCVPHPNTLLTIKNKISHKVCPVTGPVKRKVLQIRGVFISSI